MAKTTIWTGATDGDFTVAGNWSNGVPVTGDTVIFRDSAVDLDTTLDQSAITLASLVIEQSYTGLLGLSTQAADYLQIGATLVSIGEHYGYGSPAGSGRLKLDLSAANTAVTVHNTASSSQDENLPPLRLLTAGTVTLNITKGVVGVACESAAETSAITALNVAYDSSQSSDVDLVCGEGCTVTTVVKRGGNAVLRKNATTITNYAGDLVLAGTDTVTTLTVWGGTVTPNGAMTITTLAPNGGIVDFLTSSAARTVTNAVALAPGSTLRYDPGKVTFSGGLTASVPVSISAAAA